MACLITPLDLIKSFERHISSEVAMGISTMSDACAAAMPTLVMRLRKLSDLSMDHVTVANEPLAIDDGKFSAAQRQELGQVLKSVMKSDATQSQSRVCVVMQNHAWL